MLPDLKVYIWNRYDASIDGSSGLAVAIARNKEDAIAMIEQESGIPYNAKTWGLVEVSPIKEMAFAIRNDD